MFHVAHGSNESLALTWGVKPLKELLNSEIVESEMEMGFEVGVKPFFKAS